MTPVRVEVATLSLKAGEAAGVVALAPWLDGAECARAATFVSPLDSQLFVAAHALTRMLLSAVGGRAPSQWTFDTVRDGKPRVRDADGGRVPVFSLAHTRCTASGPWCGEVGVAASTDAGCELGFDLEVQDPTLGVADLAQVLAPAEATRLRALPDDRQPAALTRLWCLKEAVAKATGEGLAADLSRIGFEPRGRAVRLDAASAALHGHWHVEHRQRPGGRHAALAVRHPPATDLRVRWRRWSLAQLLRQLHAQTRRPQAPPHPPPTGGHRT